MGKRNEGNQRGAFNSHRKRVTGKWRRNGLVGGGVSGRVRPSTKPRPTGVVNGRCGVCGSRRLVDGECAWVETHRMRAESFE